MHGERLEKLMRIGRNQVLRIPPEFELSGEKALIRCDCTRLVIESVQRPSLLAGLATPHPLEERFPDVDGDIAP